LNSCGRMHARSETSARLQRILALAAAAMLASCAEQPARNTAPAAAATSAKSTAPSKPSPSSSPPIKKLPQPKPPTPIPTNGVSVIDPPSFAQEKMRMKMAIAKTGTDAVATSEIGYYVDVLMGRLKQVAPRGVGVLRNQDRIVLNVAGGFGYSAASTQPEPDLQDILNPLCKVLVEYRATLVSIHVKNDDATDAALDAQIGEQRALAVAQYLIKAGVPAKRILVVAAASRGPTSSSAESSGRAQVELELEPVERVAIR
jgi:outer membrane protein OmpA-like peptidoglycan-associated protein